MWVLPLAAGASLKSGSHCIGFAGPDFVLGDQRDEKILWEAARSSPLVPWSQGQPAPRQTQGWACQGFTGIAELRWGKSQTCAFAVGGRCEKKSSADPKVVFSVPYPGEEGSDRVALESTQCHQGHPTHQALPRQHIWTLCLPSCPVSVGSGMTGDFRMLFSKGIGNAGKWTPKILCNVCNSFEKCFGVSALWGGEHCAY